MYNFINQKKKKNLKSIFKEEINFRTKKDKIK